VPDVPAIHLDTLFVAREAVPDGMDLIPRLVLQNPHPIRRDGREESEGHARLGFKVDV